MNDAIYEHVGKIRLIEISLQENLFLITDLTFDLTLRLRKIYVLNNMHL